MGWNVNAGLQTQRSVNPLDRRYNKETRTSCVHININTKTTSHLVFVSCESRVRTLIYLDVAFMQLVEACTVNACREWQLLGFFLAHSKEYYQLYAFHCVNKFNKISNQNLLRV